jgi:arylamine N-acetyltransferase
MAAHNTYSEAQVLSYLDRINFSTSATCLIPSPNLDTLRRLTACHLSAIPWENISVQCLPKYKLYLDKDSVFDKIVNKCKGGTCWETTRAFATLLRTLGYDFYTIGARFWVSEEVGFTSFMHMAIILTLDEVEYLVDVGLSGRGPVAPMPIFDGKLIETPVSGVFPEENRIQMMVLPGGSKRNHKIWTLQNRRSPNAKWIPIYGFEKDAEFLEGDYDM